MAGAASLFGHVPALGELNTSRTGAAVILAIGLFGTWAYHAEIDQLTRGQGQIIASSRTQIIQAPDGGVIEDLRVREGSEVQRGEVLAVLESTKVEAAYRRGDALEKRSSRNC